MYVDDVVLAGTPHARRREWAATRGVLEPMEKPQRVNRFLGAKYVTAGGGTFKRELRAPRADYAQSLVAKYDNIARNPAG